MKIDFVIMWVDPNDPKWQKEKAKYCPDQDTDGSERRYRDWDNLKYWFRAVEQNAPWVNKIYFVTEGHIPKWLNLKHPKLKIVKHADFIPKKYLPTFSANPIEMNLFRIKGLSEHFVFFNDDFFLVNKTDPQDFFKNGKSCGAACLNINIPSGDVVDGIIASNLVVVNRHFNLRKVIFKHPLQWFNFKNGKYLYNNITLLPYGKFTGIRPEHLPASLTKSAFRKVWQAEPAELDATCSNKFRNKSDINHWLVKYWQICEGEISPRSVNWGEYYSYSQGLDALSKILFSKKYKAVCLNDTVADKDFERAKDFTNNCLATKFPHQSKFEVGG